MKKILFTMGLCCTLCAAQAQFSDVRRGDVIDINGVKAIVYQTDGEHGKAMSVKAFRGVKNAWCTDSKHISKVKTTHREEGKVNTEAIFNYVAENNLDINEFPVFAWCQSLGKGWYIPALQELEDFINWWFGNDEELDWGDGEEDSGKEGKSIVMGEEKPHMKIVNKAMLEAGGIPFSNGVYSSTEDKRGKIWVFNYKEHVKTWRIRTISKSSIGKTEVGRAFYEF